MFASLRPSQCRKVESNSLPFCFHVLQSKIKVAFSGCEGSPTSGSVMRRAQFTSKGSCQDTRGRLRERWTQDVIATHKVWLPSTRAELSQRWSAAAEMSAA